MEERKVQPCLMEMMGFKFYPPNPLVLQLQPSFRPDEVYMYLIHVLITSQFIYSYLCVQVFSFF